MKKIKSIAQNGYELSLLESYDGEYCTQLSKNETVIYTSSFLTDLISANILFDKSIESVVSLTNKEMN